MKKFQTKPSIRDKADEFFLRHGKKDALKNLEQLIYLSDNQEDIAYWKSIKAIIELKDEPKGFY